LSLSINTSIELAKFFINCWEHYTEFQTEDLHELVSESPLVTEHEITAEDAASQEYGEWEEGDIVYVLSDLGKEAQRLVQPSTEP